MPEYIIVQAGGKGSRMGCLTRNKPKALVPVDNLPMLFHLFRKYPDSQYVIIGDYLSDVLRRYLKAFANVSYTMVTAEGHNGTCAGVAEALRKIPGGVPFLLIWSDLILPENFSLPAQPGNYIGVAKDFPCRWKFENGVFAEERSETHGVAGLFYLQDAARWRAVPSDGELVRWFSETGEPFQPLELRGVREYGLLEEYQKLETARCRPFNRIYRRGDLFVKEPLDEQGRTLAERESAWYQKLDGLGFSNLPRIVSYAPLTMEYVAGKSVYEYADLTSGEKSEILRQIVACLKQVHALEEAPPDRASFDDAYIGKTFQRLEKVRELVPFANEREVTVNGRKCRNVFYVEDELRRRMAAYFPEKFKLIHGDCTFSNTMLRGDKTPVLIDPRGYFGTTLLYGDPAYDWSKLYYSLVGNYDQFNRKRFDLRIGEKDVSLEVQSNGWEALEGEFFSLLAGEVTPPQVKLIHAIIWLSLTTYAWEDYDSICGAFYRGLYYLEEALA